MTKVLTLFGTRPEIIKLGPVIHRLEKRFRVVNVASAQHLDLLYPFVRLFGIRIDHDLHVMEPDQTPAQLLARVLASLDPILSRERPALILVQGDTGTALAGALAGFYRGVPVGHVEAGLRSGNPRSPYPEEMNRRLISRLASYHFAATVGNRDALLAEGVAPETIYVTGNPVVDAVNAIRRRLAVSTVVKQLLSATAGRKRIVLTTHRRENFGAVMAGHLRVLARFVERHDDVVLLFPVHPNPAVVDAATTVLSGHPRIHLLPPLNYDDFIKVLSQAWLIVSDSGGIQEEVPTLGKALFILRDNTERPEVVEAGIARLVGGDPERLALMLEEAHQEGSWVDRVAAIDNPFGRGDSGERIASVIARCVANAATVPPMAGGAR